MSNYSCWLTQCKCTWDYGSLYFSWPCLHELIHAFHVYDTPLERERQTDRQTDRQTRSKTETERETQRERQRERLID